MRMSRPAPRSSWWSGRGGDRCYRPASGGSTWKYLTSRSRAPICGPAAGDHTVAGLVVFALDGSGKGGTAVVVPAGTEVPGVAGARATRLADAYPTGGLAAEREALEGVLGITTAAAADLDEHGLTN